MKMNTKTLLSKRFDSHAELSEAERLLLRALNVCQSAPSAPDEDCLQAIMDYADRCVKDAKQKWRV